MANFRVRIAKILSARHLSGWRNWIARPTTDREVAGSSPASDDFLLLFASKAATFVSHIQGKCVSPATRLASAPVVSHGGLVSPLPPALSC